MEEFNFSDDDNDDSSTEEEMNRIWDKLQHTGRDVTSRRSVIGGAENERMTETGTYKGETEQADSGMSQEVCPPATESPSSPPESVETWNNAIRNEQYERCIDSRCARAPMGREFCIQYYWLILLPCMSIDHKGWIQI